MLVVRASGERNVLRRSARLESMGYYNEQGVPWISYKEILYRIFKKRRSKARAQINNNDVDMDEASSFHDSIPQSRVRDCDAHSMNRRGIMFKIIFFVLCILLSGLTYHGLGTTPSKPPGATKQENNREWDAMSSHLKDLQAELQKLRQDMNSLRPTAMTLPNFALHSVGAAIVTAQTSKTYCKEGGALLCFLMRVWNYKVNPDSVIKGHQELFPGNCWAIEGEQGQVVVALSHAAVVSHVSLGHISKKVSPTQWISSAPKEFTVYGMRKLEDEGIKLGTFMYNQDGDQYQTFKVADHQQAVFPFVKLKVDSNWGNHDYTCLYSFKVHGALPK